ncbi:MAG: flippase-like domain-containing protein [Candidatus Schekmanbacteria bacterium]|nr:flippase-like domain-containing protein [Candidatus Schekmanbacteria bacterium]
MSRPIQRANAALVFGGIGLSFFFLFLAARRLDLSKVAEAFSHVNAHPWLELAALACLAGYVVRGMRCRLLVSRQAQVTNSTATNIVVIGYAGNNVLPARLGELVRASMLTERTGMPLATALAITFVERLLDGLVILLFFLISATYAPEQTWVHVSIWVVSVLFGVATAFVALAVVAPQYVLGKALGISQRLQPEWRDRFVSFTTAAVQGVAYLRSLHNIWRIWVLSTAVWLLEVAMFYFVMVSFGFGAHPAWALLVMSVTNLGILIPASPGFFGTFHYIAMQALMLFGVEQAKAFGCAVIIHLTFYIPITIWGVLVMVWYGIGVGATLVAAYGGRRAPTIEVEPESPMKVLGSARRRLSTRRADVVLRAIIEALVDPAELGVGSEAREQILADVFEFSASQIQALPMRLRVAFRGGIWCFCAVSYVHARAPFAQLSSGVRRDIVELWAFGPVGLARQLFRPIRSVAYLAYYDHPEVQRRLADGTSPATARGTAVVTGAVS